jgi:DNA polymerase-3 subunit epsilon
MENDCFKLIPNKTGRYVIFDTETTGIDPHKDNIIEIAAVEIVDGSFTGNQFHAYLKARTKINKFAQEKHKITQNFYDLHINGFFKTDKDILKYFLKFVGDSLIFAHNAQFDFNFINNELKYWNLDELPKERFRCTMRIVKMLLKDTEELVKKKCSLSNCCEYFNVVTDTTKLHNALYDSYLAGKVLMKVFKLVENKNTIIDNEDKNINTIIKKEEICSEDEFEEILGELKNLNMKKEEPECKIKEPDDRKEIYKNMMKNYINNIEKK